jgi:hypothetical protein
MLKDRRVYVQRGWCDREIEGGRTGILLIIGNISLGLRLGFSLRLEIKNSEVTIGWVQSGAIFRQGLSGRGSRLRLPKRIILLSRRSKTAFLQSHDIWTGVEAFSSTCLGAVATAEDPMGRGSQVHCHQGRVCLNAKFHCPSCLPVTA